MTGSVTVTRIAKSRLAIGCLAALIGAVSGWMTLVTGYRLLFDYLISPIVKDAYIYPQWRYRLFDVVLVAWCFDGLAAAFLLFRSLALQKDVDELARRAVVIFFVGLPVLIAAGAIGMWLRSKGL